MLSIEFFCPLPNGLHARPAWALKEQCSAWRSDIRFINRRLNTATRRTLRIPCPVRL